MVFDLQNALDYFADIGLGHVDELGGRHDWQSANYNVGTDEFVSDSASVKYYWVHGGLLEIFVPNTMGMVEGLEILG